MKIIRITVTDREGTLLDCLSMEIPDDHTAVYVKTGNSLICPQGGYEELIIGTGELP